MTVADLLDQLAAEVAALNKRDDEFTSLEFATRSGMNKKAADYFLGNKVAAKELKRRRGLADGNSCWLYSATNQE